MPWAPFFGRIKSSASPSRKRRPKKSAPWHRSKSRKFSNIGGFVQKKLPKLITIHYYGTPLRIEFSADANNDLAMGKVLLTKAGHQLAPISGAEPIEGFIEYAVRQWVDAGLVVYSPLPNLSSSGREEA
jgi:hypothetical protein